MKKLTKEQKEKRKHILKITKNVIFYISLALNTLVIIALCVGGGCSKNPVSLDHNANDIQLPRLSKYQYNDNQAVVTYDLTIASDTAFSNSNIYYGNEGYIVKGLESTYNIITSNLTLDNVHVLDFRYSLHPESSKMWFEICGWDNANLETLLICSSFTYENGAISRSPYSQVYQQLPTYVSTYGFWFCFNETITSSDNFDWENLLPYFFNKSGYVDYNLYYNWSPFNYFNLNQYVIRDYVSSIALLNITSFSINGLPYDKLEVLWASSRNPVHVYDGSTEIAYFPNVDSAYYSWIIGVDAVNSNTNVRYRIWEVPPYEEMQTPGSPQVYYNVYVNGHFTSGGASIIRLFDVNLNFATGVAGYTNANILGTTNNGSGSTIVAGGSSSNTASLYNVFTLFTMAFQGLGGLFAIQIVPGITLGSLLFVPLVGIVVFALIHILRK